MTVLKRSREDHDREAIESLAMANCLMLLSTVGKTTNNSSPLIGSDNDRVFSCKTCNKKFPTFQALGGHRASHKKIKLLNSDLIIHNSADDVKPKTHQCSICGLKFSLGQALGGHMRRHRDLAVTAVGAGAVPVREKPNTDRLVFLLDLNLTPYENGLKFA